MAVNPRWLRLRAAWGLVLPFLWFARPTGAALAVGAGLGAAGLILRGWAAGTIRKDRKLAVGGPYAFVRHPLYLGSLMLGTGVTVAGGSWPWVALFLAFYVGAYGRAMRAESELLTRLFGDRYRDYAARVPALLPRLTAYRPGGTGDGTDGAFRLARYMRNREWEALLGAVAGYGLLAAKWAWLT